MKRVAAAVNSRIGAGGISFLLATASVNLSNLGFHVIGSRLLGPVDYGAFGALLNLLVLLSVPVGAVQAAITQEVAGYRFGDSARGLDLRPAYINVLTGGAGAMGLVLLTAPLLDAYLHVHSQMPLTFVALWLIPAAGSAFFQGVLVGEGRFALVGAATAFGTGLGRLLVGVLLMNAGLGVSGAMAATVIGQAITMLIMGVALRDRLRSRPRLSALRIRMRDGALSLAAMTGIALLGGIDTILARHYLSSSAAGNYAAGVSAGRIALFLPAAFAMLAFPRFASGAGRDVRARRALRDGVLGVCVIGSLTAALMAVVPSTVIRLLFGPLYGSAPRVLGLLAAAAAGYGLVILFSYYFLARKSLASLVSWPAAALMAALIFVSHHGVYPVAGMALATIGLAVIALSFAAVDALLRDTAQSWEDDARWKQIWQPASDLDVSIVVPFYNPGPGLSNHLLGITEVLEASGVTYEVIAVSDGSTDGSENLSELVPASVRCLRLPENQGKGAALHFGMAEARGRYLGFIDGDGDLPPDLLGAFVDLIRTEQPDIVLGSKRHPDSRVTYPWIRRCYSFGYQQLTRLLFRLNVRDTQTGVKLIRRDVLAEVLPRMLEKRFAFDLELLVVARQLGHDHIAELPVSIKHRFGSTIHMKSVMLMLTDTCAIFYRLRVLRFYGARRHRPVGETLDISLEPPDLIDLASPVAAVPAPVAGLSERARQKRILLYNWRDLTHPAAGGAEVYAHQICREWVGAGHQVTLFTSRARGQRAVDCIDGVKIVRRGGRFGVYRAARRYYRREAAASFDLVVDTINTRPFSAPNFVFDAPVVAIAHQVARDVWRYETPWPVAMIGRYLLEPRWLRRYRDVTTITISESSKESLELYGLRRVVVVPIGMRAAPSGREYPPREGRPTVAFVGRLTPGKRPEDALRAFGLLKQRVPDAQMWVIGAGPLEKKLRRAAPSGVHFLGRVSEEVKRQRLARAHAVLMTSVREGWGLVVSEAASVGTPTIGYDVPGVRDSVASCGGHLVPPRPADLAEAMAALLPQWTKDMPPVVVGGVATWAHVAAAILALGSGQGSESRLPRRARRRQVPQLELTK